MALPMAQSLQIIDPVLTNLAIQFRPDGFIAEDLVPALPVQTLSGQYPVYTKNFFYQNEVSNLKADRASTREISFEFSTNTYLAKEYALKVSLSDLELQQAHPALKLEQSKVQLLTTRMLLSQEVRIANLLRTTGNGGQLTNGATPSVTWDQASSTWESDIKTGVQSIYSNTGQLPNTIVIPYNVAYAMAIDAETQGLLKYTVNGQEIIRLGAGILPAQLHGMRVVIPQGPQVSSAREGGTESDSEIWGKHVRLLYVDPNASWGIPSVAYRFQHTAMQVTRWRDIDPDVSYIRQMHRQDEKVVSSLLGYELSNVIP